MASGMVGTGLNCCLGFKAFQSLTNTMFSCWSIFLGGDLATRMLNHIYFGVTFVNTLRLNEIVFLLSQLPLCYGSFPQSVPIPGIYPSPTDQQWIAQHHKCFVP